MPASEAQIRANQANAQKSTGPKTPEGKEASRANSYKHGMTATKVFPEREAEEVERRYTTYSRELKATGDIGAALVLRAATLSTRMERCVEYEKAVLTERVRQAEADFVPPAGVDSAESFRLRKEAGRRALFDPSKEASLARKYEAAAERGFFRCLKELRQREKEAKAVEESQIDEKLASIMPGEMTDEEFDALEALELSNDRRKPAQRAETLDRGLLSGRVDLPIAVGKPR